MEEAVIFLMVVLFFAGFKTGHFICKDSTKETSFIVEKALKNEVYTNNGLKIKNEGFHVGDTLVIITKQNLIKKLNYNYGK